jgi:hypothetical protein
LRTNVVFSETFLLDHSTVKEKNNIIFCYRTVQCYAGKEILREREGVGSIATVSVDGKRGEGGEDPNKTTANTVGLFI